MRCLEHLVENGLLTMKKLNYNESRAEWIEYMKNDVNLPYTNISLEDLWTICQYIIYVLEECNEK